MAPGSSNPPPPRRGTLPQVDDPIPERSPTNEDLQPLGARGRVNWLAAAKMFAKAAPVIAVAIAGALVTGWQIVKPMIIEYREATKERTDKSYELLAPVVNEHTKQLKDIQARLEKASSPAQPAPARRGATRRPTPAVVAIPPAQQPPIVSKPLPRDLDRAIQQNQSASPATPRTLDAGP